ncbi:MAG: uroporphyrinogen decarboxylase family protein [Kiritimatiellae bacterium]|nr:uroporphyrinogen decarboxylase family protein [Kiritimatiellia bacterium]
MTSKQRVQAAVRHLPPDRVPTLYDDFRGIGLRGGPRPLADGWTVDDWGLKTRRCEGWVHGEFCHPVATIEQLRALPIPDPLRPERWEGVAEDAAAADDHWTLVCLGATLWERMHFICGMENAMAWLYEYPEDMELFADRILEYHLAEVERLGTMGIDCIFHQDDWGNQQGLMISPAKWREFFKPRYAQLFGRCHALGMANFMHSCGNILDIMADLAEIGLDVLQVQQPDCMGLERVFETARDRLTLSIMPDIQVFLPTASVEQVRKESARILALGRANEGWMIADTYRHWPDGIPAENVEAWEETVKSWSFDR